MSVVGLVLSGLTIASMVGMIWLVIRRAYTEAPFLFDAHLTPELVVSGDGLQLVRVDGGSDALAWGEIAEVRIRTTDLGPFSEDVHWEIEAEAGATTLVVPGSSAGILTLLDVAPDHLPGFDHEAAIEAMASTDHAVFQVWPKHA